ncbi:MAG TPA: ATP-binding protein [Longimicrobiales bacterium]
MLLLLCWPPAVGAQDRLVRRFAADQGLAVPPVWALAQDAVGFLWIATQGGIYRYDGVEFRQWAPERIDGAAMALATTGDGRIVVQVEDGGIFEITADGAVPLPPPPGGWSPQVRTVAFDDQARLWTVGADSIPVVREAGVWTAIPRERLGGEGARKVRPAADGGMLVLTDAGLWHIAAPDSAPRKRFDTTLADAVSLADGRLIVLTIFGGVFELVSGEVHELASRAAGEIPGGRPIALAERNGTIWVALDRSLVAIRPGQAPEVVGRGDGIESGGPLLVDREGSLWLGSFSALFQYPEPETVLWTDRHGLPGPHVRYVARSGDVLWVTTWQGTGIVRRAGTGFNVVGIRDLFSQSRPCTDSRGIVWVSTLRGIVRLRGDRVIARLPERAAFMDCAAAAGADLWIATVQGLRYADVERGALRRITGLPFDLDDAVIDAVLEDRRGRLWAAGFERICHAPAAAVRAGRDADWSCETVPGIGNFTALVELPDGTLWGATRRAAVLARTADGWAPLPANTGLASRNVFTLVPSPVGGIWIAGHGILLRVRPGGPDGWEVLEAPGPRNGLPSIGGADLIEDDDGTLWITTSLGLLHVPPTARFARIAPPRVVLVDARVGTEPVPLDRPLELPADRNRLELRFAALSFRAPGRVHYQVRLAPDAPWEDTRGQPSFRWVDLPPGRYHAEVRASLDGRRWLGAPTRFAFRVLPPWYRTPWALALFAALGGAVLWAAYRARLAFLLGLERQRTRIAMDLHDELGSGLGSIGILAGLLARGRLDDVQRGRLAQEVAGTAEELGNALGDIVWSLDRRAATLEELASRLAGHAERFFAGDDVVFTLRAPREWPPARLPLALRRNILLIGLEALHNAARHARARQVALAFTGRGRTWQLAVTDDGVGLGPAVPTNARGGRGLPGMRRRAAEIGAAIEWRETPGGGTTVVLHFTLPGAVRQRVAALRGRLRHRRPRRPRPPMA